MPASTPISGCGHLRQGVTVAVPADLLGTGNRGPHRSVHRPCRAFRANDLRPWSVGSVFATMNLTEAQADKIGRFTSKRGPMRTVWRVLIGVLVVSCPLVVAGPAATAGVLVAAPHSTRTSAAPAAPAVEPVGTWPTLQRGATNPAVTVRSLQYLLNAHGAGLTVDGIFGNRTNSAVRDYQFRRGLVVDGIVGPRTWSSLLVTVRFGSVGPAVEAFQDQMNARSIAAGGVPYLAVDGVFGPKTEAAAYYMQNRLADYWGIDVDGIVGPQTWQPLISNVLPRG